MDVIMKYKDMSRDPYQYIGDIQVRWPIARLKNGKSRLCRWTFEESIPFASEEDANKYLDLCRKHAWQDEKHRIILYKLDKVLNGEES